jgi:3-methylfumaryl-CoA hydratase
MSVTPPRIVEMRLDEWPVQALNAALELRPPSAEAQSDVPPLWHWLYFLRTARRTAMGNLCIREERDIVYLPGGARAIAGDAARPELVPGPITEFTPDPVLLFRFSALTFNAHRIHYDRRYAQEAEGYRERIVHGPLVAILLADLLRERTLAPLRRFEFRAQQPLFVNEPIRLSVTAPADQITLRAFNPSGAIAMEAQAWV